MVKIRQHLVPNKLAIVASGTNRRRYIDIHETANTSRGANANAHARLQAGGNSRSASWHYQVDDKEIVQSYLDTTRCWHAGGSTYALDGIAIEICVNSDGDYAKALKNAQALVKHLRKKHNIPATRVISHNFITGKNCPTKLLASGDWDDFVKGTSGVGTKIVEAVKKAAPKVTAPKNVRTDAWLKEQLPRITKGTSKNSVGHLVGLYQRQQIAPYRLVHDQHWGNITDQHYRWVHALQVELNKWKGTKIPITKTWDKATRDRVIEWQTRNMGGEYKGTIADGVVGPLTIKPLGLKAYPN